MRRWFWLPFVVLLSGVALADHNRSRCIIVFPSSPFVSPTIIAGSDFIEFARPVIPGAVILPGTVVTTRPFIAPPVVVASGGFFCAQFQSGNWSLLWCEPLRTNVVIIGRPCIRYVRPVPFLFHSSPFVVPVIDPSIVSGAPSIWHSPILQPGTLVFRLRHRSAEEVAKVLNEARVLPDGQFAGMGNILIVSAPSLATSGVQQSRLRDLVSALDQPAEKPTQSSTPQSSVQPKEIQWRVEIYHASVTPPISQERLPSDRARLLELSGYKGAHKAGEGTWSPTKQGKLSITGDGTNLTLQAQPMQAGWQFHLSGTWRNQPVQLDGQTPNLDDPILLIAPLKNGDEAVLILLLPEKDRR